MKKNSPLKPFDIPVIMLAVVLALIFGKAAYSRENVSSRVVIKSPQKTWIYPMNAEETVSVIGSIGETRVEIGNNRALIVSSPCGEQTCVAAGELRKNGQWAACLPNRVFLLIEGTDDGDTVDASSW